MRNVVFRASDVVAKVLILRILFIPSVTVGVFTCTILICDFIIRFLLFRLPPSIIATLGFGLVGTHIAACPFRARRQSEVYHVWVVFVGT